MYLLFSLYEVAPDGHDFPAGLLVQVVIREPLMADQWSPEHVVQIYPVRYTWIKRYVVLFYGVSILLIWFYLFYMYSFFCFFLLIVLYVISEPIIIFYHTFPFLLLHNLRSSGHKPGNIHVLYITLQINRSSACFNH